MHEYSVTESILRIASEQAQRIPEARRVTDIKIQLGQLVGFSEESIRFFWQVLSQGTTCEGARLHFEHIPAELHCIECDRPFAIPDELVACPSCSGTRVRIVKGSEFLLESIEVETS
jgi:hydrogenase nickel incorporation protein HypA/HybF